VDKQKITVSGNCEGANNELWLQAFSDRHDLQCYNGSFSVELNVSSVAPDHHLIAVYERDCSGNTWQDSKILTVSEMPSTGDDENGNEDNDEDDDDEDDEEGDSDDGEDHECTYKSWWKRVRCWLEHKYGDGCKSRKHKDKQHKHKHKRGNGHHKHTCGH